MNAKNRASIINALIMANEESGNIRTDIASTNQYEPLQGFYASPMYRQIIDDYGFITVSVWPILEIAGSEVH